MKESTTGIEVDIEAIRELLEDVPGVEDRLATAPTHRTSRLMLYELCKLTRLYEVVANAPSLSHGSDVGDVMLYGQQFGSITALFQEHKVPLEQPAAVRHILQHRNAFLSYWNRAA